MSGKRPDSYVARIALIRNKPLRKNNMTKHGNISIEKVKSGNFTYYKLRQVGKYEKTCMSFDESELHDLELCLHKLKITESDKLWEKETKNFNN